LIGVEAMMGHVVPFVLVMFRLSGLFVGAPLLSSASVPQKGRVLLLVMLSAAIYPLLPPVVPPEGVDILTLLPMVARELLIGLSMGVIASVPLAMLEMSGVIMGQQVGFGLAKVYNPELEFEADVIGQMLFSIGAAVFITMGGLETLLTTLAGTFERLPVGGMSPWELPVGTLSGVIGSGFSLAMRVAAPVTGIVLLLVILFGVIGKTMPQLNVMTIGFAIKILAFLAIAGASVYSIEAVASDEIARVLVLVRDWANALGG
jgi:flagellar biosynthesis protein FliR